MAYEHKEELINILHLKPVGRKGWYSGKCPFCGKENKFGVKFDSFHEGHEVSSFNCFSGSCGERGVLKALLEHIGRLDLWDSHATVEDTDYLEDKLNVKPEEIDLSVDDIYLPFGFRRIYSNDFLENEKGFFRRDFEKNVIGITDLEPDLRGYLIFMVVEDGSYKAYVGRLLMTKTEYKAYEKKVLAKGKIPKPRFKNSLSDFIKLLYGIDEITFDTEIVILVEGITDKQNIDKLLELDIQDEIKCLCTFGKKISDEQILKLLGKGIKEIVLLYDPDAVEDIKFYAEKLDMHFSTKIGYIEEVDLDPGTLNSEQLSEVMENLQSVVDFSLNKLQKREL
jgi:5S rRNA maturation endonuclease (ribonuclease M5)